MVKSTKKTVRVAQRLVDVSQNAVSSVEEVVLAAEDMAGSLAQFIDQSNASIALCDKRLPVARELRDTVASVVDLRKDLILLEKEGRQQLRYLNKEAAKRAKDLASLVSGED